MSTDPHPPPTLVPDPVPAPATSAGDTPLVTSGPVMPGGVMATGSPVAGPVRAALERLCAQRRTGALRVLGTPGGTLYLVDGRLAHAECPVVNGIAELLIASGRLSAQDWSAAIAIGGADERVGDVLVQRRDLTAAELELVVLTATLNAALFQLDAVVATRFEPGVAHPVGPVRAVEFELVCAEVDRRRRLLSDAWPDDAIDTVAVGAVRRLPGHHVALTATQWEIVANADRVRTPIELARLLGRDTFAFLLDARRLARAGLIEVDGVPVPAVPAPTSAVAAISVKGARGVQTAASPSDLDPDPDPHLEAEPRPLPRRCPGGRSSLIGRRRYDEAVVPTGTLLRIRQALEEQL